MPDERLGLRLTPEGARAAVLGHPVAHSLSPVLHRAAYQALGLTWTYDAIDCDTDGLAPLLATAGPEWVGYSCTMPLKRTALALAANAGSAASTVGAANTLVRDGDGWRAENTDVDGVRVALCEVVDAVDAATVLGAGGTAQATIVALSELGARRCTVEVRDPARCGGLRRTAERAGVEVSVRPLGDDVLRGTVVVSTLPPGAADAWARRSWRAGQVVLDVVYAGWPTALARAASAAGATVVSGAQVLLHQAAAQVVIMTGRLAPVEAMRTALRAAAPGCGV